MNGMNCRMTSEEIQVPSKHTKETGNVFECVLTFDIVILKRNYLDQHRTVPNMNFLTSKDSAPVPSSPLPGDEDERMRSQTNQLLEHRVSSLSAISGSILGTEYLREHLAQQYKKLHHGGCSGNIWKHSKLMEERDLELLRRGIGMLQSG
eukprot:Blabericola_migrator_1__10052@NODE_5578_length_727_cov_14_150000_g3624_i0_p1_GENE_NODE_5578_length_727_cov_14_150000_g3624_i0NODE_5578_length_727_cov_14_150000_g3624_i0_p1_ORF_typecomplete_len150_score7_66_NODE_5578_length_727_cov_14_150000_g3624_i0195644